MLASNSQKYHGGNSSYHHHENNGGWDCGSADGVERHCDLDLAVGSFQSQSLIVNGQSEEYLDGCSRRDSYKSCYDEDENVDGGNNNYYDDGRFGHGQEDNVGMNHIIHRQLHSDNANNNVAYSNKHYDEESYHANDNEGRKGYVTGSMHRTRHNPRRDQFNDIDDSFSYNNEESIQQQQQYSHLQQCEHSQQLYQYSYENRENEQEQSYYENYSGTEYDNNNNNKNTNINSTDEREWQLDRIDFNQIQRPQSIFCDQEDDYYDADDEYQHVEKQNEVPKEVVCMPEDHQLDDEYQLEQSFEQTQRNNDQIHEKDDSSIDSDQQHTTKHTSAVQPIFHGTSESLDVIKRIESVMESLIKHLDRKEIPVLRGYVHTVSPFDDIESDDEEEDDTAVDAFMHISKPNGGDPKFHRNFGNIAQSRSFTSICLVMSFIHQLLLSNRTTTTREVYYVFVTHFRNQKECDGVILDVAKILGVSRRALGLSASPKGWFCGCVEITRKGTLGQKDVSGSIDGTALSSIQGLPITKEWTERNESGCTDDGVEIKVTSKNNAKVILVIEKEGVYNRLSEERIFDRFPCILVTGKGFPDLATRALVSTLHTELELPVIGLCDCNPFGISVLALYHYAGDRMGIDGRMRYSVPIQWLGLRPSEVARLKDDLPETVFQKLTDLDSKRIASLLETEHAFLSEEDEDEVREMEDAGYKVELEALYWLGPDYMGNWVVDMLSDEYD